MIISVDAHKNKIAVARWHHGSGGLSDVHLIRGEQKDLRDWVIYYMKLFKGGSDTVVIEKMQIYPNERVKDPNDLLEVSKVVGMCHFLGETLVEYTPREWKGQLPKRIHHARIRKALSKLELDVLGRYIKNEHVLDAVGIGLHYLRRI